MYLLFRHLGPRLWHSDVPRPAEGEATTPGRHYTRDFHRRRRPHVLAKPGPTDTAAGTLRALPYTTAAAWLTGQRFPSLALRASRRFARRGIRNTRRDRSIFLRRDGDQLGTGSSEA